MVESVDAQNPDIMWLPLGQVVEAVAHAVSALPAEQRRSALEAMMAPLVPPLQAALVAPAAAGAPLPGPPASAARVIQLVDRLTVVFRHASCTSCPDYSDFIRLLKVPQSVYGVGIRDCVVTSFQVCMQQTDKLATLARRYVADPEAVAAALARVWGVFEAALARFGDDERIAEHLCRAPRYALRTAVRMLPNMCNGEFCHSCCT